MSHHGEEPVWKHLVKGLGVTLAITLVVQFIEFHGALASAEGLILDHLLKPGSRHESRIVTLEINDEAYQRCFAASSPLKPAKVLDIVKMVARTEAKVVGVDIITDSPEYVGLYKPARAALEKKVVWIAGIQQATTPSVSFFSWLLGRHADTVVSPTRILGADPPSVSGPEPQGPHWGIPVFPRDDDAGLRRLYRNVAISADPRTSPVHEVRKSWAMTMADLYRGIADERPDEENDEPVYVVYADNPPARFEILDVLACGGDASAPVKPAALWEEFKERAAGKIVLVGGTFTSARDSYPTPVGLLPGLIVNGYAVQSQLDQTALHEERRPVSIALDLAIGTFLVLLFAAAEHRKIKPRVALFSSLLILAAAFALTWRFPGPEYLPAFAGIMLGVMLDQLHASWELLKEHEK